MVRRQAFNRPSAAAGKELDDCGEHPPAGDLQARQVLRIVGADRISERNAAERRQFLDICYMLEDSNADH